MIFLGLTQRILCTITCGVILASGMYVHNSVESIDEAEKEVIEVVEETSENDVVEYIEEEEVEEVEEEFNFTNPLRSGTLTSRYGTRWGRLHAGIDIANSTGTAIYAAQSGDITFAGWSGNYGNLIIIQHSNGYETYYAHCSSILVSVGDKVEQGQLIGKVGCTGNATGPHVHFEIRLNGNVVDPYTYIY